MLLLVSDMSGNASLLVSLIEVWRKVLGYAEINDNYKAAFENNQCMHIRITVITIFFNRCGCVVS
jgi:hypothetical protein